MKELFGFGEHRVRLFVWIVIACGWFPVGCILDEEPGKDPYEVDAKIMHSAPVVDVEFTPDGGVLASASEDGTIRLLEMEDMYGEFSPGQSSIVVAEEHPLSPLHSHGEGFTSFAFSNDGTQMAAATGEFALGDVVKIWNMEDGLESAVGDGYPGPVRSLQYLPQDDAILVGSGYSFEPGQVSLWDLENFENSIIETEYTWREVYDVKASADGSLIASSWDDGGIRVWDAATEELIYELAQDDHVPYALAFSPDGAILASTGDDSDAGFNGKGGIVRLWDMTTGELEISLEISNLPLLTIEFSPAGEIIAVAGELPIIFIVDVENFVLARSLDGHTESVNSVAFSPNGELLASGSDDNYVRLWSVADLTSGGN